MARKFATLEEAAQQLGISPEQLNDLRQEQQIYGYRDGASWKFKPEDVDRLQASLADGSVKVSEPGAAAPAADSAELADSAFDLAISESALDMGDSGEDVVLLSELELGESGAGTSSTIIGKPGLPLSAEESDVKLSAVEEASPLERGSDLRLEPGGSGIDLVQDKPAASGSDVRGGSAIAGGSDIRLVEDDQVKPAASGGSSAIQLGDEHSDDELVLDSSGPGSDVTLSPGDSGISLLDPSDSGLSLEAPIDLGAPPAAGEAEFELAGSSGEPLAAPTEFDSDEVMELKSGDDFLLTPLGSPGEEESDDSGSQVIALDSEASFEETDASMFGSESESMSAMLEEEPGAEAAPLDTMGLSAAAAPALAAGGAMIPAGREAPMSLWFSSALIMSFVVLLFCGMFMYDLVRNMWSWDKPFAFNSWLMDTISGILGLT